MKIRNIVLWFMTSYGTALFLEDHLSLGFDFGETVVCAIVCALIAVGMASGWTPDKPGADPPWMRGKRY